MINTYEPMTRGEYLDFREFPHPDNYTMSDKGYCVSDSAGNTTWIHDAEFKREFLKE